MEYDLHECPSCGIDHQALDLVRLKDVVRFMSGFTHCVECPETGETVVINVDDDLAAVATGVEEGDMEK